MTRGEREGGNRGKKGGTGERRDRREGKREGREGRKTGREWEGNLAPRRRPPPMTV